MKDYRITDESNEPYEGEGAEQKPAKYRFEEIEILYSDPQDPFLHWVAQELISEKQERFRHKIILVQSHPMLPYDIGWESKTVEVDNTAPKDVLSDYDVGDIVPVITITVLDEIRNRNRYTVLGFSRLSFTAGDNMWKVIADEL